LHFQDNIRVGVRVVRGEDWDKGNEDGGEGNVGTVMEILDGSQEVRVQWDSGDTLNAAKNGDIYIYRTGQDGKYDLRIFDNAQAGKTFFL
jgi:E3 ubiquitin-protein ligase mind-bomb